MLHSPRGKKGEGFSIPSYKRNGVYCGLRGDENKLWRREGENSASLLLRGGRGTSADISQKKKGEGGGRLSATGQKKEPGSRGEKGRTL